MSRTLTGRAKDDLWKRAGKKCEACGIKISSPFDGQVGHKVSYALGGETKTSNLVYLCYNCNRKQGTMSYEKFLIKQVKIEPKKYKKAYLKMMNEKKNFEINKLNKKLEYYLNELKKTKSKNKILKIKNKVEKEYPDFISDINKKYKHIKEIKSYKPIYIKKYLSILNKNKKLELSKLNKELSILKNKLRITKSETKKKQLKKVITQNYPKFIQEIENKYKPLLRYK